MRTRFLLAGLLLAAGVGLGTWLSRPTVPDAAPAGRMDSGVVTQAPVLTPGPPAPLADAGIDDEPPATDPASPAPGHASEPVLRSGNTDGSFARRAGLHHAPNPLQLTASVALAVEPATGRVLYERNAQAILPIASLTKLLAGMVLLEAGVSMRATIRVTDEDIDTLRHSRSRVRVGTRISRYEALRLALMSSENRAAHALARTYPGGEGAFVAAMNRKAQAVGMAHSTFVDPTGLSNRNRATAQDVAKLVAAAARHPLLRQYSTTRAWRASFGPGRLRYVNSNRLVRSRGWPIQLQKTGYIVEAGQCLAMAMRIGGKQVVLVLLDAGSARSRGDDARKLRRWVARELARGR